VEEDKMNKQNQTSLTAWLGIYKERFKLEKTLAYYLIIGFFRIIYLKKIA
jgi:hypothetical protein